MERNGQRELTKKEQSELICPHHNLKLVLREAKTGVNRGSKFWGCPTWYKTACNYTVPYKIPGKLELPLKEKIMLKIIGKNGKISILKVIGQILMLPVYLLGMLLSVNSKVFREIRK